MLLHLLPERTDEWKWNQIWIKMRTKESMRVKSRNFWGVHGALTHAQALLLLFARSKFNPPPRDNDKN